MIFTYKALKPTGEKVNGKIEAKDEQNAKNKIRQLGIYLSEMAIITDKAENHIPKRKNKGRQTIVIISVIFCLFLIWHGFLSLRLRSQINSLNPDGADLEKAASISVNPLTNLVSIKITLPSALDNNPFSGFGLAFGKAIINTISPIFIERNLNNRARELYDLYAIIIPYRVSISTEEASPDLIAKARNDREKQKMDKVSSDPFTRIRDEYEKKKIEKDRAKAKAETERLLLVNDYISNSLLLEGVEVAPGKRYGRTKTSVFGTIVNNGSKTLDEVTIRIYFLNSVGQRIGEKDFIPVLVTKDYSMGDNTPIRPAYRKDFGYLIEDDAPSGWSKQIEAEIFDIRFSEK